jgi:hypothetical protein
MLRSRFSFAIAQVHSIVSLGETIPMIKTYYRAAVDLDLKALAGEAGSLGRNLILYSLPVASLLFVAVYLIWHSVWAAAGIGAGLFIASLISNLSFFREMKRREGLKADAKAVETLEVSASRVLDLEFVGDHGPAYCFFVGDGKALLLVGQWLLQTASFPCVSYRLHRWSDTKRPIRIEPIGPPIEAEHSSVRLKPDYRSKGIELFDAAPETLQQDLGRAFGKIPA